MDINNGMALEKLRLQGELETVAWLVHQQHQEGQDMKLYPDNCARVKIFAFLNFTKSSLYGGTIFE